jgi:hypothetical protein
VAPIQIGQKVVVEVGGVGRVENPLVAEPDA